jgi:hypothetical protein
VGGLRRGALARRRVAGVGLLAHEAHEVIEEGELLAHERAVHAVLAGDLVEQATKLGAAGASDLGLGRRHQAGEALERDARGLHTELGAGAREDRDAVRLEAGAEVHLALDVGEAGHDALHVLAADGLALREDRAKQAARGLDLGVEVAQHLGGE